jgi:hypothetical protein
MSSRKMQSYNFRGVDDFLSCLPDSDYEITCVLRDLVFQCIPDVREKLSYNVPFYRRHQNICFIWPGSIFWGNTQSYKGVRFGFSKGYLLADDESYLLRESRKQVYWKDFKDLKEIDAELLSSFILQAASIDESMRS